MEHAEAGVAVAGIELYQPMIDQLRTKADEDLIPVVLGDMTTARVDGSFNRVFVVFNGISNVLTQDRQIAVFENAARHLAAGGRFVIELPSNAGTAAGPKNHSRPSPRTTCRFTASAVTPAVAEPHISGI